MNLPKKLTSKLNLRRDNSSLRSLTTSSSLVDFSSNDYLGFAKSEDIFNTAHQFLIDRNIKQNGATGSRLLSGNYLLYNEVETFLSDFHQSEFCTIFNSGYDANVGFFSSIPQRGDIILYDEFIHASIRDGIKLSNARSFKFKHNDVKDLENIIIRHSKPNSKLQREIYVVTESVFSMDGDSPDLVKISKICKKHSSFLIVDEAHAIGIFGKNGCGIIQDLHLNDHIFARIITFGKALGCHGAAILGSAELHQYLVNFSRSLIYTTGLPPHSLATIKIVYQQLEKPLNWAQNNIHIKRKLQDNIAFFKSEIKKLNLTFIKSESAIHCCVIPSNKKVKYISKKLQENGFDVKAILSPTVPENKERLRFCLHSYNSKKEISKVLRLLSIFVTQ